MCRHIGSLFGKRLGTILLRHRIRKHPDSPSTRYRIRCGFIFSTLQSGSNNIRIRYQIRRMRVDGSRIQKEKVADSKISGFAAKFAGCVWTEVESRNKKSRIQKYPDLCERGLSSTFCLEIFPTKRDNYKNFTVSAYNSVRRYANINRAILTQSQRGGNLHIFTLVRKQKLYRTDGISVIHSD